MIIVTRKRTTANKKNQYRRTFSRGGPDGAEGKRPWYKLSKFPPLSVTHPKIAAQWHPTKNGVWEPSEYTYGSNAEVWWKCPNGPDHVWKGAIWKRTNSKGKNFGCPFCEGQKVCKSNSLATLYPAVARQWHKEKNGDLTPRDVVATSDQKRWWKCKKGPDHVWLRDVYGRTIGGTGCPFCYGRYASVTNCLATREPEIAKQWHQTKNKPLTPKDVPSGSNKSMWWQCPRNRDHVWQAKVNDRTSNRQGCPFCSGNRVSTSNCLAELFPDIAAQWHPEKNGELTADQVTSGSNRKVWWKCEKAFDHEWQTSPVERTNHGTNCPFCAGRKAASDNCLATLSPYVAEEWNYERNKPLTPHMVVLQSGKLVWWRCRKDPTHEWKCKIQPRSNGQGLCPFCRAGK